jgi:hypothetical protein
MGAVDSLIALAFTFENSNLRNTIEEEVSKAVKTMADKYGPYISVNWKVYCDESNNTKADVDNKKINIDIYLIAPDFMSDYVKVHIETTISTVTSLPK